MWLDGRGNFPPACLTLFPFTWPLMSSERQSDLAWGKGENREQVSECAALRRLSWHPFHGGGRDEG